MKKHLKWVLPLLLFIAIAPFTPSLDLAISAYFYKPDGGFSNNTFNFIFFHYGEIFGLATGAFAALIFLLSFLRSKWKKWRQGSFAIVFTLIIGAGLLTNVLLKGYWGRPRPKQIVEFGGNHLYRPFWQPNFDTKYDAQKSFPSGHVAMGFYFLSLCLVGKRTKNPSLLVAGIILTIGLGGSLMLVRVAQGGHFFSDVIASPVLMWLVALGIDRLTWGGAGERALFLKQLDTSQEPDEISMV